MKLKIGIFFILAVALMSCSSDDIENDERKEKPIELNATISLSIANSVQTKAENTGDLVDLNGISRLSLAVFVKDKLLSLTESVSTNGKNVTQIENVPVAAGHVKLILFANYNLPQSDGKNLREQGTDIIEYMNLQTPLSNEENRKFSKESGKGLTMSSDILEYDLAAGHNYIGFEQKEISEGHIVTSNKIKLHKNVSRVEVDVVYLDPSENYKGKGNVTFTLKEIFVANVKQYSRLISDGDNGVEAYPSSENDFWLCGDYADATGALKENKAIKADYLKYSLLDPPTDFDEMNVRYPFLNNDAMVCSGVIAGRDEKGEKISVSATYTPEMTGDKPHVGDISGGVAFPIGTYFYVYENYHTEGSPRTLLIVKGDYTYEPVEKGKKVTLEDRFYAVTINKEGESQVMSGGNLQGTPDHNYVKRNNIYYVNLTVKGPGSDSSYDIQEAAHMSALVKVKDWDVVDQNEEVD